MALQKQKRKKVTPRNILIIGLILLAVAVCGILATNLISSIIAPPNEEFSETTSTEEKSDKKPDNDKKSEETKSTEKNETEEKKATQNYEGANPNEKEDLTGIITTSRVSDDKLVIRVSIDQYLTSGTCKLTLKKPDKTYEESTNITSDASTSTCEGFDIPVSKLESGIWNILIDLSSNDKNGKIEGEVEI